MFDFFFFKRWLINMITTHIYNFKTLNGASTRSMSFQNNCQEKMFLSQISYFHLFGNEGMREAWKEQSLRHQSWDSLFSLIIQDQAEGVPGSLMAADDSKLFRGIKCWVNCNKLHEYFIRLKGLKNKMELNSTNTKQLLHAQNSVSVGNNRDV